MFRDAALVAGKDLRLEARARVVFDHVLPMAVAILVLFGFALDPDRGLLTRVTPGLFWVAVLFSAVLAVQRAYTIESGDGIRDALRLSGLRSGAIFLGKFAAVTVELLALEALLLIGVAVLYSARLDGFVLLVVTCVVATVAMAAAGTLLGVMAAGLRVRETLLPLLLLPVLVPVLIAATRAFEAALLGTGGGWSWVGLLAGFALVYTGLGTVAFGPLLEES